MACRSCARPGNFGQGICQSCTLMEAMHKPKAGQPTQTTQEQYERTLRQAQQAQAQEQARAMQERYEYERQAQERARQQQRSPYEADLGLGALGARPGYQAYFRTGPSPQEFSGKVIKQMYLKIV